jgi:hypothetical protein
MLSAAKTGVKAGHATGERGRATIPRLFVQVLDRARFQGFKLGATMSHRQLHGWILLPLVICAVGAHH